MNNMKNKTDLVFSCLDVCLHSDFLVKAHKETFYITFGKDIDDKRIERELELSHKKDAGVFLDGHLVGICDMGVRKRENTNYGWVHFFYLAPEYRRRGLGKQLVSRAEEFCYLHNLKTLGLRTGESNTAARSLYESCGFIRATEFDRTPEVGYIKTLSHVSFVGVNIKVY